MSNTKIFLLAAGNNKNTEKPCSLWLFLNGESILDWQIYVFKKAFSNSDVNIIVGYNYQKIIDSYPCHIFHMFLIGKIVVHCILF